MGVDEQQHEGTAPLLEPAVLVVTNCPGCRGTGYLVRQPRAQKGMRVTFGATLSEQGLPPWEGRDPLAADVPNNTVPHDEEHDPDGHCDGSGRVVQEMVLSEFVALAAGVTGRYQPPSPSELRRGS